MRSVKSPFENVMIPTEPSLGQHDQRGSNDLKTQVSAIPPSPLQPDYWKYFSWALLDNDVNTCCIVNTLISKAVSNLHTRSSEKARENVALSCLRSGGLRKMEDSLGRNQLSILQIQELATELQNVNDLPLSHAEKSLDFGCCPNWGRGQGGSKSFLSNIA